MIKDFTRVKILRQSLTTFTPIDYIMSATLLVLQCAISDHKSVFINRKINFISKIFNKSHHSIKFQDYNKIDVKAVEKQLSNMKLKLNDPQNINEICNQYNEKNSQNNEKIY